METMATLATAGYSDCKNVTECLSQPENTSQYRQLETVQKRLRLLVQMRLRFLGDSTENVNELLNSETLKEKNDWINGAQTGCVHYTKTCRTLPLRGKPKIIGTSIIAIF